LQAQLWMQCAAQRRSIKFSAVNKNESIGSMAHALEQPGDSTHRIGVCRNALPDEACGSIQRRQSSAGAIHAEITHTFCSNSDFRVCTDCSQSHFVEAGKRSAQRT